MLLANVYYNYESGKLYSLTNRGRTVKIGDELNASASNGYIRISIYRNFSGFFTNISLWTINIK